MDAGRQGERQDAECGKPSCDNREVVRLGVVVTRSKSSIKAGALVTGRMMARLVHFPYQVIQPNTFPSIIIRLRASEMPEELPRSKWGAVR
jgi:hypothetical protein